MCGRSARKVIRSPSLELLDDVADLDLDPPCYGEGVFDDAIAMSRGLTVGTWVDIDAVHLEFAAIVPAQDMAHDEMRIVFGVLPQKRAAPVPHDLRGEVIAQHFDDGVVAVGYKQRRERDVECIRQRPKRVHRRVRLSALELEHR